MTNKAPVRIQRDYPRRALAAAPPPKPLADELDELAARVSALGVHRGDPERFHADKSDVAAKLRDLARSQRGDQRRAHSTTWRA